MKYNKIRICYKISLLISIKAFHINKLLWPLKISENLRFSNYFRWKIGYVIVSTLFDIRSKIWQNTYCNPKVNMHSQYGSQSQYAQSIWLTKSIWTVAFKATCVSPLIFKIISARWRHLVLRNVTWGKCSTSWKGYLWSYTTTMLILIIICW